MAARNYFYAESLARSTTTSTTYVNKTTLTWTALANTTYYIFGAWLADGSTITISSLSRLTDIAVFENFREAKDLTDIWSVNASYIHTQGASSGSRTETIDFASETASQTTGIKEAVLVAIEKGADDVSTSTFSTSTTTSATFVDADTLIFIPPSAGDYLIISTAGLSTSNATLDFEVRLLNSGTSTEYGLYRNRESDTTDLDAGWGTFVRLNLAASSQTFKIQFRSVGGATITIDDRVIVAIRLDAFNNNYYSEARARTTTTSNALQDKINFNPTENSTSEEHLQFFCANTDYSQVTSSQIVRSEHNDLTTREAFVEPNAVDPVDTTSFFNFRKATTITQANAYKIQFRSETSGQTSGILEAAISVLQMTAAVSAEVIMAIDMAVDFGRRRKEAR